MRLLIVEDSEKLRDALLSGFSAFGWAVDMAADGAAARPYLAQWDYDVVILDLMMPRVDGLQLLREIRQQGKPVRVLVLSARDQITDRVQALRSGSGARPGCGRLSGQAVLVRRTAGAGGCLDAAPPR